MIERRHGKKNMKKLEKCVRSTRKFTENFLPKAKILMLFIVLITIGCHGPNIETNSNLSDMTTIILVDPFETVMVSYPSVLIHRERYQQLIEYEMQVIGGDNE